MRNYMLLTLCAMLVVFAGCQSTRKDNGKFLKNGKDATGEGGSSALSIFSQDLQPLNQGGSADASQSSAVSPDAGKASPYEALQATEGKEIPLHPIPEGKVFKSPSEISPELAAIFSNIHFEYDSYEVRSADVPFISAMGKHLLENPSMEVRIEGHCDERGTREYNLVLGEQRSLSARRFLVGLGVSPSRLHTVSYGKDKPADTRSNEEAWFKNRRAEFKIAE